jgi:hypothetical protein
VIFSFVDKSMASLRTRCQPERRLIRGLSCLSCDGDHAPTGCLSSLPARPLVAFGAWHTSQRPGTPAFRPHEDP